MFSIVCKCGEVASNITIVAEQEAFICKKCNVSYTTFNCENTVQLISVEPTYKLSLSRLFSYILSTLIIIGMAALSYLDRHVYHWIKIQPTVQVAFRHYAYVAFKVFFVLFIFSMTLYHIIKELRNYWFSTLIINTVFIQIIFFPGQIIEPYQSLLLIANFVWFVYIFYSFSFKYPKYFFKRSKVIVDDRGWEKESANQLGVDDQIFYEKISQKGTPDLSVKSVLLLRSFLADGRVVHSERHRKAGLIDYSFERVITDFFDRKKMEVYKLGVSKKIDVWGATIFASQQDQWQSLVKKLIGQADLILVLNWLTPGVNFEIDYLIKMNFIFNKVVFVFDKMNERAQWLSLQEHFSANSVTIPDLPEKLNWHPVYLRLGDDSLQLVIVSDQKKRRGPTRISYETGMNKLLNCFD